MKFRLPLFFSLISFFVFITGMAAQVQLVEDRFAFEPDLPYDESIIAPKAFLEYELGERFTIYEKVVQYFQQLAASTNKMTINQYGETYEGRKLYNVVITSADNHQNLASIKKQHFKLSDPRNISEAEANALMEELPIFTSMSYNIHGNEASGSEAVMQVAYRLVAATDQATEDLLNQSVIILYICINPDGRDRYVYWYNSVARNMVGLEPADLEHYEPWPGGRTNHYWFDLNRDWVWRVHPESKGHTTEYQKWLPNLHVDYHEQGYHNNYFTVPGTTPRNLLFLPEHEQLSDTIGRANIAAFNQSHISYFTRENFDFFYPGYGSSYPGGFGAIAMLTEQGGISAGRAVETEDGSVLKLRQRVFDHYTTSIATMKKAAEQKRLFRAYSFKALHPENSKSQVKAYILPNEVDPYLSEVIQILLGHNIEVHQANADFSVGNAMNFRTGDSERVNFKAGDYLVKTDQPRHLFINSILQHQLEIEDSVMYDMSTWSAPLAYNLTAYSTNSTLNVDADLLTELPAQAGSLENANAQYAYVVEWKQRYAPRALAMLWQKGYRVRSSSEAFKLGGASFSAGSLIVLVGRNLEKKASMAVDMASIAKSAQVAIQGFNTGRMDEGRDLGSPRNRPVKQPKIALLVDPPFSSYTAGQIYYLFDQETQLPIQRIKTSALKQTALPPFRQRYGRIDLKDFDVLILPGGGSGLRHVFKREQLDGLKEWVREGGVLIATENAANYFTADQSKFTTVKLAKAPKDTTNQVKYLPYEDRRDYNGKKRIPGTALNTIIDVSNPLAFGVKPELYGLKFGNDALLPANDWQTVGHYTADASALFNSGYASKENLDHLAGKSFAGVYPIGAGKVVFLMDNTQYRMFWRGPSRMMQNAVMLLPGF